MKTIGGRRLANREELAEHTGYSKATLANLWRDREDNGHPEPEKIDGVMRWDVDAWDTWFAEYNKARRNKAQPGGQGGRPIDRTGDPDEELAPVDQAKVLGVDASTISYYRRTPPPGWPDPARIEQLPGGGTREYRTRRQLWHWHDTTHRAGKGGRRARSGADPRVDQAAKVLAAQPGRKAGEVAADLAAEHGGSVHTWKRIVTEARQKTDEQGG
ncbi:hypothetical protein P9869_35590 [Streptomyces ossamyceticus]|nr:hypothetical protein [Streptomyces ossamyceticus]